MVFSKKPALTNESPYTWKRPEIKKDVGPYPHSITDIPKKDALPRPQAMKKKEEVNKSKGLLKPEGSARLGDPENSNIVEQIITNQGLKKPVQQIRPKSVNKTDGAVKRPASKDVVGRNLYKK